MIHNVGNEAGLPSGPEVDAQPDDPASIESTDVPDAPTETEEAAPVEAAEEDAESSTQS